MTQPHFTTDFSAVNANSATTPAGLTPHDGLVVAFLIPPVPTTASISSTAINFGSVDIGGTATQTVTITNTTSFASTVNVTNIAISGTNAGDFSQTSSCTSLTEGQSCTITLTFAPTAVGVRDATLTVTDDSTSDPTLVATLTGTGVNTTATLSPASADFGSIYAGGGTSAAKLFTVTNTSQIAIAIKSIAVTGNFTETNTCGTTLAASATCTVSVIFAPLTAGALTGTLTVTNSSTANPTLTASLTGTGLPTTATLSPLTDTYTTTIVATTSVAQIFTWTNTSAIALTISKLSTTGDFSISSTSCSGSIAAGASCAASVVFTPTALGARTGTFTVASSSSANPTLTATLTGTGVADVQANVSSLAFGNVDLGSKSAPQTLTITNYTNASIALTSLSTSGDYAYTSTCPSNLAGLSTCTVSITFTPTALGTRTGTLTVLTNDTKYPVITVGLTGNGVDFSIAVSPTSGNLIAGYGTSVNLTITPLGGFSAPITLSCVTTATGSNCTPSTATLALSAVSVVAAPITTTSQYTVIGYTSLAITNHPCLTLLALLSTAFLVMARRRRLPHLTSGLALLLLCVLANGCSGKLPAHNEDPTYPGTYTYTFSATDGTLTHTTVYTLTVTAK